ncbi:Pycsar system effector family protein [Streptomyces sp. NPDC006879]|uniref:Pycsar system effector family protein n=1 Tax=Streptomyces sp. NPDC006879 TaxID=3364767 RepID=UPI0036825C4E
MTTAPEPAEAQAALIEVRTELSRADHKAATLLALFSAIAAGVVATFVVRSAGIFALWNGVEWAAWAGIVTLACSLGQLLYCVRPVGVSRLAGPAYFAYYAQYQGRPADLVAHLSSTQDAHLERCSQLIALSVLATRKYRLIARAVDLLGLSLVLIAGATLFDALH